MFVVVNRVYEVRDVASLSGVTVRTLHYYDAIGLLSPERRERSGYRIYGEAELFRLQQIQIYRELGLPLEKIKAILSDPDFDTQAALQEQRTHLVARVARTNAMINAIDVALEATRGNKKMDDDRLFDGFYASRYEGEARARWGDTSSYLHSAQRTQGYSPQDWERIRSESDALMQQIGALAGSGAEATDGVAMDLAEEHRSQIDRFYYLCSRAMHGNLGAMYLHDSRFADNLNKYGDGVAAFLAAAIAANAARDEDG